MGKDRDLRTERSRPQIVSLEDTFRNPVDIGLKGATFGWGDGTKGGDLPGPIEIHVFRLANGIQIAMPSPATLKATLGDANRFLALKHPVGLEDGFTLVSAQLSPRTRAADISTERQSGLVKTESRVWPLDHKFHLSVTRQGKLPPSATPVVSNIEVRYQEPRGDAWVDPTVLVVDASSPHGRLRFEFDREGHIIKIDGRYQQDLPSKAVDDDLSLAEIFERFNEQMAKIKELHLRRNHSTTSSLNYQMAQLAEQYLGMSFKEGEPKLDIDKVVADILRRQPDWKDDGFRSLLSFAKVVQG